MKITSFNPQIITKDAEAVAKLFEEMGFEKRHNPKGIGDLDVTGIRMKDANGFHVDVVSADTAPIEKDLTSIRINVDDFDEAYQTFINNGFRESEAFGVHFTPSSKYAFLVSPSGFVVDLVKHIKKED